MRISNRKELLRNRVLYLVFIFVISVNIHVGVAQSSDTEIYLFDVKEVPAGIKYIYKVESGGLEINYWEIVDVRYKANQIVGASEGYVLLDGRLRFIEDYLINEQRDVWFILSLEKSEISEQILTVEINGIEEKIELEVIGPVCVVDDEEISVVNIIRENMLTLAVSISCIYFLLKMSNPK